MLFNLLVGRALRRWIQTLEEKEAESASESVSGEFEPIVQEVDEYAFAAESLKHATDPESAELESVFPKVQREAMGSLWEIYLAGADREQLIAAGEEALNEIDRLDRQLSHYKPDSDVSRINAIAGEQWVRLEPGLYFLLKRCAEISEMTGGAFDITTGPLSKAWGFFSGDKRIPPDEEINSLLEIVGTSRIQFDDEEWLVLLPNEGMEINLGAIGKGYAIDQAVKTLALFGAESAVLHGGQSTIYAMGGSVHVNRAEPSEQSDSGWRFEIKDPRDKENVIETVFLKDEAISTSGSYEDFFEEAGIRYSHILDPRTGVPAQGMLSVSVIAQNAADSDAFSTAFFVMGRKATEEFCRSHPELRVIMMELGDHDALQITRIGF
jgi:thiamine biosynthesis lipoprotein